MIFDNCTFDASAHVLFSKFRFSNVVFRNCTFRSRVALTLGTIRALTISKSRLGPANVNATAPASGEGDLLFSQVTLEDFHVNNSVSSAEIRIQQSDVEDLEVMNSELGTLHCHEKVIAGRTPEQTSQLNDSFIVNSSFADGLYLGHCQIRGLEMHNTSVRNSVDLSSSTIDRLAVLNASSLSNETCSTFDLSKATVRGDMMRGINTTKATFRETHFASFMNFHNFSIAKTSFDLTRTTFTSEIINNECCTVSCVPRKCLCDVPLEPETSCPRGNSSVNINVQDSCFPGDALVSVVQPDGAVMEIVMRDLQHGDHVVFNHEWESSPVFFFGHKSPSQRGLFRVLVTICQATSEMSELAISHGHLLPVQTRGLVPSRSVVVGNVIYGADGLEKVVVAIRDEIKSGVFAPTTINGILMVNGVLVSSYTDVVPIRVAHAALAPLRASYTAGGVLRRVLERVNFLHERSGAPLVRSILGIVGDISRL